MLDHGLRFASLSGSGEVVAAPAADQYISICGVTFANPTTNPVAGYLRTDGAAGTIIHPGIMAGWATVPSGYRGKEIARCDPGENLYVSSAASRLVYVAYRILSADRTW